MLRKYPRTPHLQGSRLQPGDEDLDAVAFAALQGKFVVVEEKLDGANAAISFASDGTMQLQSRGHYLTGGPRERQFGPLKAWAPTIRHLLWPRLRDRFIVYGEWLYAKHTVFYDALPHFFLEFDVFDRERSIFLSTDRRRELLAGTGVRSVPVLRSGSFESIPQLTSLVGPSTCRTAEWRKSLVEQALTAGLDPGSVVRETDVSDDMEGLYLKIESGDETAGRLKWVRPSFLTTILDSGTHWLERPIVPNRLASS